MQTITISGNLGKDAELRTTQSNDDVLSFSVGSKQGYGDKASTNWFRCTIWGKRARNLRDYLFKGMRVVVQGELLIGSYEGKPQYDIRVNEIEFMSRAEQGGRRDDTGGNSSSGRGEQRGSYVDDLDESVPF